MEMLVKLNSILAQYNQGFTYPLATTCEAQAQHTCHLLLASSKALLTQQSRRRLEVDSKAIN